MALFERILFAVDIFDLATKLLDIVPLKNMFFFVLTFLTHPFLIFNQVAYYSYVDD